MSKFINKYGPSGEKVFTEVDESFILDRIVSSIEQGQMTPVTAAAAVSDFYKTAMQKQLMATNYNLFGLDPAQAYNITIPKRTVLSITRDEGGKINLANPTSVENYLTRLVAARSVNEMINQGTLMDPNFFR